MGQQDTHPYKMLSSWWGQYVLGWLTLIQTMGVLWFACVHWSLGFCCGKGAIKVVGDTIMRKLIFRWFKGLREQMKMFFRSVADCIFQNYLQQYFPPHWSSSTCRSCVRVGSVSHPIPLNFGRPLQLSCWVECSTECGTVWLLRLG